MSNLPKHSAALFHTTDIDNPVKRIGEVFNVDTGAFFQKVGINPQFNTRSGDFPKDEEDQELIDAIYDGAQVPPIECIRIDDTDDPYFQVISGHRRFNAFKCAIDKGAGIKVIPIRVIPKKNPITGKIYTEADLLGISVSQNRGKPLSHSEMTDTVMRFKRWGWTNREVARVLSMSEAKVSSYITLDGATPELKQAVDEGQGNRQNGVGFAEAVDICRNEDDPAKINAETKARARSAGSGPGKKMASKKAIAKWKSELEKLGLTNELERGAFLALDCVLNNENILDALNL